MSESSSASYLPSLNVIGAGKELTKLVGLETRYDSFMCSTCINVNNFLSNALLAGQKHPRDPVDKLAEASPNTPRNRCEHNFI